MKLSKDALDFMCHTKKEEASSFVKNMSDEMRELAPKYLELFVPSKVEMFINQIEQEIGMEFPQKRYNMRKYRSNYNMLCRLVKNKKRSFGRVLVK